MTRQAILLFVLVVVFAAYNNTTLCREFPTIHYTVNEGLPSNTVYNIYRSHDGFLWMGTDKGVARYNGVKFEKFTTFDGLADNEIFFCTEDAEGRIWFAAYNGQLCFYKDGIFHNASNTPFLRLPFTIPFITKMNAEKDRSLSIYFLDHVLVNVKGDRLKVIDLKKITQFNSSPNYVSCSKLSAATYKIRTFTEEITFDTSYNIISKARVNYEYLRQSYRRTCVQDQAYIISENGMYNSSLQRLHVFPANFMSQLQIFQSYISDGNLWITTDKGLFLNDSILLLKGKGVSCVNQDINGNYWVSTLGNGMYFFDRNFKNTFIYKDIYKGEVNYTAKDGHNLLFGTTEYALYRYSNDDTRKIFDFTPFLNKEYDAKNFAFYVDGNYRAYCCRNREIIVADNVFGKNTRVKSYVMPYYTNNAIRKVDMVGGAVYVNSRSKVYKVDIAGGGPVDSMIRIISDTKHSIRIFDMCKDARDVIWFSTADSMYEIVNDKAIAQKQFRGMVFKSFTFWNNYLVGYTQNNQLAICAHADSNVDIDFVTPQNCIWSYLYPIDSAHLLLGTDNLYRLLTRYPGSGKSYTMTAIENPFIPLGAEKIVSEGNHCYFLKDGSMTGVPITDLLTKPQAPRVFFKSLKTNQGIHRITNNVSVSYDESKQIVISFSCLSFGAKDVSYQYSISKDATENWRELAGEDLNLVNPGYGKYVVKIRARTITSSFAAPITFSLHILKPFWAQWWFIAPCGIALITLVGIGIRTRTRELLHQKEKEHDTQIKFMRSEYKALNALMNPHFIFNTLNNVQGLVNKNERLAANEYLRVFADLVRQNMHNVSKELIPLQKEIELLTNYLRLERLRFKDKLNYSIEIDEDIDLSEILIPPLLVQPLVENSIKHGILPLESGNGFVKIKVHQDASKLYIEVKDNGVGMAKSLQQNKLYSSFGLENVRKRLDQLSIIQNKKFDLTVAEIKSADQSHLWTVVTITMPFDD